MAFEQVYEAFQDFHSYFGPLFGRREARDLRRDYPQALLVQSGERRNAENLPTSARAVQRFLTESPWDYDAVMERRQEYLDPRLERPEAVWVLDGSGFPKQGRKSAGVARQYCGRLGKVANCQVGIFPAFVSPLGRALVDKRLYLPESWTSDRSGARWRWFRRRDGATGRRLTWPWRCSGRLGQRASEGRLGCRSTMPLVCRRRSGRVWRPWGYVTSWTCRQALRFGWWSLSGPLRPTRVEGNLVISSPLAGRSVPWRSVAMTCWRRPGGRLRWPREARVPGFTDSAPKGCDRPAGGSPA